MQTEREFGTDIIATLAGWAFVLILCGAIAALAVVTQGAGV